MFKIAGFILGLAVISWPLQVRAQDYIGFNDLLYERSLDEVCSLLSLPTPFFNIPGLDLPDNFLISFTLFDLRYSVALTCFPFVELLSEPNLHPFFPAS